MHLLQQCIVLLVLFEQVEKNFLSPYVSPRDTPFRHILLGSGPHTFQSLVSHLDTIKSNSLDWNDSTFRTQFALATSTIQGCANSLMGDIWVLKMTTQ